MKFHETTFEEYLKAVEKYNFHKKIENVITYKTDNFNDMNNLIIYGRCGIGKYSQVLLLLKQFSDSQLKYEKKMVVNCNKSEFIYKISDIHYEIDMGLLGCNSKILWNEIFLQIVDIVSAKKVNNGFIVCKNFQNIQIELLDIFYSYIQKMQYLPINIKYIIITEDHGFIPENIINNAFTINLSQPSKNIIKNKFPKAKTKDVENLKELYSNNIVEKDYKLYDDIVEIIKNPKYIKYNIIREKMYDLLIYNIDINNFIYYMVEKLIEQGIIPQKKLQKIMDSIFQTMYYYNNNYRPIYHLEKLIVGIINELHEKE